MCTPRGTRNPNPDPNPNPNPNPQVSVKNVYATWDEAVQISVSSLAEEIWYVMFKALLYVLITTMFRGIRITRMGIRIIRMGIRITRISVSSLAEEIWYVRVRVRVKGMFRTLLYVLITTMCRHSYK
jgi:hypothetical protein